MREQVIQKVLDRKLIAIVRGVYGEDCLKLGQALYDGGIELLEVTFDLAHPERFEQTAGTVALLSEKLQGKLTVGAGTVTSVELLELAQQAGAQFIISPDVDKAVIERTRMLGLVSLPGAMTPSEILSAHSYGADLVKIFPASVLGAAYFKAVCSPINHIGLLAVGGVNENNLASFLQAGAVGAGVGGNLVNKEWIRTGRFDLITELARQFVKSAG